MSETLDIDTVKRMIAEAINQERKSLSCLLRAVSADTGIRAVDALFVELANVMTGDEREYTLSGEVGSSGCDPFVVKLRALSANHAKAILHERHGYHYWVNDTDPTY